MAYLAGPRPSQMLVLPRQLVCKRSRYSNRTVKYFVKAVGNNVNYTWPFLNCDIIMT